MSVGAVPERREGAILIVEDNEVNLLILRAMLRKRGYEPYVATDGAEGVAMTVRHQPRLVLMDLQMPRLDGIAAATEILTRLAGAAPVIVAVTANASDAIRATCQEAGFAEVLSKPLIFDDLIATVERHLGEAPPL